MTEAGIVENWEKNYQIFMFLDMLKRAHNFLAKEEITTKNYTNYFQKAITKGKKMNSVSLVREGEPIGLDKIKMLFLLCFMCIGISGLCYILENNGITKACCS